MTIDGLISKLHEILEDDTGFRWGWVASGKWLINEGGLEILRHLETKKSELDETPEKGP